MTKPNVDNLSKKVKEYINDLEVEIRLLKESLEKHNSQEATLIRWGRPAIKGEAFGFIPDSEVTFFLKQNDYPYLTVRVDPENRKIILRGSSKLILEFSASNSCDIHFKE